MLEQGLTYTTAQGSKPGVTILALTGPFVIANMFQLQSELRTLQPACLIVDMASVPYMDSAGLGVLMNSFVSAQSHGRKFLLAGVNERIRSLFEMTQVDSIFRMYDSVQSAESEA